MRIESVIRTLMSVPWWIKLTWVAYPYILCQNHTAILLPCAGDAVWLTEVFQDIILMLLLAPNDKDCLAQMHD